MRLFNSLKSEMNRMVPSFLGMINVGQAHSLRFTRFRTPTFTSLASSTLSVASWIFGMGNGLA